MLLQYFLTLIHRYLIWKNNKASKNKIDNYLKFIGVDSVTDNDLETVYNILIFLDSVKQNSKNFCNGAPHIDLQSLVSNQQFLQSSTIDSKEVVLRVVESFNAELQS